MYSSSIAPTVTRPTSSKPSRSIKKQWDIDVVAGNVATAEGCSDLIAAGADAVKVGIGPGSICTTRVISGVGVPQITAIYQAAQVAEKSRIPIIADGGIRYSGDLTKAMAAGAHVAMIGGLFAGLQESPRGTDPFPGTHFQDLSRDGLVGGHGARLQRTLSPRRTPRPGQTRPRRRRRSRALQRRTWVRSSISLWAGCGRAWDTAEHELSRSCARKRRFIQVTPASVRESHPHDITITQEAPNYSTEHLAGDGS